MKIALLITISLDSPSGLRYLAMAKALVQQGHDVTLISLHHDLQPSTPRRFADAGVKVRYVGQMNVRKVGNVKLYFSTPTLMRVMLAATWQMLKQAVRLDCDLIHVGKPLPMNGLPALLGGRLLRGRPVYVDCDDYEAESNRFGSAWLRRAVVLSEDRLPRLATGVTVNTRFAQARYEALGVRPERMAYVPNGIDRERFAMPLEEQVDAVRRRWELEGRPVVAYVGTLSLTAHPVDLLLDAFARLRAREPRAVLLLVGGGEDYDRLRARAAEAGLAEATRFAGWVTPGEIPACLAAADVSVDPIRDDLAARGRSPLKIVESLAVGTPVVTGDAGDRREMLADGRAGILVQPGNAEALADGLARVLGDADLGRVLSEGALAQRERYCWDNLVQPVIRLYEQRR